MPDMPLDVCPACGSMRPEVALAIDARDEQIALLQEDAANLERELRGKRSLIRRLRAAQDAANASSPQHAEAMEVLEFWKQRCSPKARELGGKRLENVLARLNGGYTKGDLMKAVIGYSLKPYVVSGKRAPSGGRDDWHADAELIFRDSTKVDNGIRIADHADELRQVLKPTADPRSGDFSTTKLSPMGQKAADYARFGWAVFPVRPGEKAPANSNGVTGASKDVGKIEATWSQHPELNIGLACGRASGLVVLDVDGDLGWDSLHALEDVYGEMPQTASITTPSGGQHFYFEHPGVEIRNTQGVPGAGLDVRGDGGYVLAPPSIVGDRRYEVDEQTKVAPLPLWLLERLLKHQTAMRSYDPARYVEIVKKGVAQGQRNGQLLSLAGHLYGKLERDLVLEVLLATNAQKCSPPLPPREVEAILKSVDRMREREDHQRALGQAA